VHIIVTGILVNYLLFAFLNDILQMSSVLLMAQLCVYVSKKTDWLQFSDQVLPFLFYLLLFQK